MESPGRTALAVQLRSQAEACAALGSPFYARLLELAAQDAEASGVVAEVLSGHERSARDDGIALRMLGAVHRLVLAGEAPALRSHYPSVGGDADADAAWPLVLKTLDSHRAAVADGLTRAPQTNEVGRSAALVGALHHLVGRIDLPVKMWEIGSSGGLNLRADAYRVTGHDDAGREQAVGPADSALVLADGWDGAPPSPGPVRVVERRGCDLSPVDATTEDGALTLMSYVWPDQVHRGDRLRAALAIARQLPATVVRAGAADFLADLTPAEGHWTVVWHSVMWQYVAADEQQRVVDLIARAGSVATERASVARLAFEPYGDRFVVAARTWPDIGLGASRELLPDGMVALGEGSPHGLPLRWL